jgi:DNA-binding protein HU-beta
MAQLVHELLRRGRVEYRGLGSFTVETYPPRKIHNPATGKTIELPARKLARFKPSNSLTAKLNPAPPPTKERKKKQP